MIWMRMSMDTWMVPLKKYHPVFWAGHEAEEKQPVTSL